MAGKKQAVRRKRKRIRLKKEVRHFLALLAVVCGLLVCAVALAPLAGGRRYSSEAVLIERAADLVIVQDEIPPGHQNRPQIIRQIRWIVIHETDNTAASADALHHGEYLRTNETDVNSWHYTVDDHTIVHSLPDNEVGWHAGDQLEENGGNLNGIGIELCVNEGNDFEKTLDNAAALCAELIRAYHLRVEDIRTHQDFSGKHCPRQLLDQQRMDEFRQKVEQCLKE